jgi:glycosyltransferase involved in cell wall biosynthesis
MKGKKVKVTLIQRICPHYRVPVFRRLAEEVDLTLYYGRGLKRGAQQNAAEITGFKSLRLPTIGRSINRGDRDHFITWFPTLIPRLIKDKPEVIIVGGATDLPNNLMVIPFAKLAGIPVIWWDAGRDISFPPGRLRTLVEPVIRLLIRNACACIAYGEMAREYLSSIGIAAGKIFVARNTMDIAGIDRDMKKYSDQELQAEKKRLKLTGKKILLYVGSLERRKKLNNLLRSFKDIREEIPDTALLIIGDGIYREDLEKFIKDHGIEDVNFLGRKVEDVGLYFLLGDIFIQPGWSSLALVEAMAYGKPVITVPYGGPEYEVVEDGITGIIIEKDDISGLTEEIRKLITDDERREKMGRAARDKLKSRSMEGMVREMVRAVEYCYGALKE